MPLEQEKAEAGEVNRAAPMPEIRSRQACGDCVHCSMHPGAPGNHSVRFSRILSPSSAVCPAMISSSICPSHFLTLKTSAICAGIVALRYFKVDGKVRSVDPAGGDGESVNNCRLNVMDTQSLAMRRQGCKSQRDCVDDSVALAL